MNPWLEIPIEDYEGHMSLPSVGQAAMLADCLARAVGDYAPSSVAVLGCAGGNGLERILGVRRVVAVDVNPRFVRLCLDRFDGRFLEFSAVAHDLSSGLPSVEPVDLVFAGLLLEYLDWRRFVREVNGLLRPSGVFVTVLQTPSPDLPEVSDSPYRSLLSLESVFRFVSPDELSSEFGRLGFRKLSGEEIELPSEKSFHYGAYQAPA